MTRKLILMLALSFISGITFAETKETERLATITKDYAKCADVALGNFPSDEEAQKAIKTFYKAMIVNVEKIVAVESESENETTAFFLEVMGKNVFIGYLLKGFSEVDDQYKTEKKQLKEQFNYDWRQVNETLWKDKGCNAIHLSLSK